VEDKDEEIDSDDSDLDKNVDDDFRDEDEEEEDLETAEEKRLRLAKAYLEEIEKEERARTEAGEEGDVREAVSARLQRDTLEESGKLRRDIAHLFKPVKADEIRTFRDKKCARLSVTCVAVTPCGQRAVSGSKDGGLIVWRLEDGRKLFKAPGGKKGSEKTHPYHCGTVNALAVSSDGEFLASGDESKMIFIWRGIGNEDGLLEKVKVFRGHRDAVTGLAFRKRARTLYSCSADRSVKIWSLDEMAYVETLFGHQDRVTGVDAGVRERAITCGGRDGSVRVWKIVEESQLVFNAPPVSVDAVKLINEEHFATAGEEGRVSIWGVAKKKPLTTVTAAHGLDDGCGKAHWITALTAFPMSDLIATGKHKRNTSCPLIAFCLGSCDGFVRLWRCAENFRSLQPLQAIPLAGFVNALSFTKDGKRLVAGVGQEHRLGRWRKIKAGRNGIAIIPLETTEDIM